MKLQEILDLLLRIQWSGDTRYYECPECHLSKQHGHKPTCQLALAILDLQNPREIANA